MFYNNRPIKTVFRPELGTVTSDLDRTRAKLQEIASRIFLDRSEPLVSIRNMKKKAEFKISKKDIKNW